MAVSTSRAFRRTIYVIAGSCALVLIAAVIVFAVVISQPIKARPPEHSSAAAVALAKSYLGAIADGDAAKARAIDKDSFGASTDGVDNTTFTAGSALRGATERIHDVTYRLGGDYADESWVDTTYRLAGKTYKSQLGFKWDDVAEGWHLESTIANLVNVYSYSSLTDELHLPFTLGGVSSSPLPGSDGTNAQYYSDLVYPAVYPLKVTIDPATLADPSAPTTTTLLVPPDPYKGGEAKFLLAKAAS